MIKLLLICFFSLSIVSCATNSKSRWAAVGIAAPLGAGVGALSAPEREKPEFHAFTWGSAFVAMAALLAGYYYSDDQELEKLRKEVEALRNPKLELITEGEGYLKGSLKNEKEPVKWKVYKIDRWTPDGEDVMYHQDLMIKKEKKSNEESK